MSIEVADRDATQDRESSARIFRALRACGGHLVRSSSRTGGGAGNKPTKAPATSGSTWLAVPAEGSPTGGWTKRSFDIFGGVLGLILLSPLLIMLAVLVKGSGKGPALYGHSRIGHGGRSFRCLKFRTMVTNGDEVLQKHLQDNPAARAEWAATRKLKNDPRITSVGVVLRRLSLDELPQIFNIINGQMSIVGPRPVVTDELAQYGTSASFYLRARPGLTGIWQVSGRSNLPYERRVALDREYVENWSMASDLRIVCKTIPAVCLRDGSY